MFRVQVGFIRTAFRDVAIYRVDFWIGLLSTFFVMYAISSIWFILYQQAPNAFGVTLQQMTSYGVLGVLLSPVMQAATRTRNYIASQVRSGSIEIDLMKPVGFLAHMLARNIGEVAVIVLLRGERSGIPEALEDSFTGLSHHVLSIDPGHQEQGRRWLHQWLSEHVEHYVKICDPLFGIEELHYLLGVPPYSRITIVTTDDRIKQLQTRQQIKQAIEGRWQQLTSQAMPRLQLIIVPSDMIHKFSKRVIISERGGLILNQSLSLLGLSRGKIGLLQQDESKDIESEYVDLMLNIDTWFAEDIEPRLISINNKL